MATENDSKCVWNYNSIKKLYDELKDKKRTDDEEKEFLFVEAFMSNNASIEGFSFDEGLDFETAYKSEARTILFDYHSYLEDIFAFYDMGDDSLEFKPYDRLEFTTDDLLNEADNFFKNLNDDWYKLFLNLIKCKDTTICFAAQRSFSCFFPSSDFWIANIKIDDTIQSYVDTIHEFAHGIADQMVRELRSYNSDNILIELFPMVCQMIWLYDCDNLDLQHEITKYISNYFKIMQDYAEEIRMKYNIAISFVGVKTPRNLSRLIKKNWDIKISREEIEAIYASPVEELFNYVYPFIISLELFEIYKNNKEDFFKIMNEIVITEKKPREVLNAYNLEPNKSLKLKNTDN